MTEGFGIKEYLDAKFQGIDEKFDGVAALVEQRFEVIDSRLDKIENAGPRAGMWGGVGTMIGAAVVFVVGFFNPNKQ